MGTATGFRDRCVRDYPAREDEAPLSIVETDPAAEVDIEPVQDNRSTSGPGRVAWGHGSLAVVVPVQPITGRAGTALTRPWLLQGLFPGSVKLPNPNEVTWDPIVDRRIAAALHPTATELWLPKSAQAEESAKQRAEEKKKSEKAEKEKAEKEKAASDAAATEELDSEDTGADVGTGPPVVDQAQQLTKILARAGWRSHDYMPDKPDGAGLTRLPQDCTVRAIELLTFDAVHAESSGAGTTQDLFLVIHLSLSDEALIDPGQVAAFFGRTAPRKDQRTGDPNGAGVHRVLSMPQWKSLLRALKLQPIGHDQGLLAWRPFVISHLVPAGEVPPAPFTAPPLDGHPVWPDAEQWAWRMTGGSWLTQTWSPGRGATEADRRTSWLGSTLVRGESSSLTFVATRPLSGQGTRHPREGAVWWEERNDYNAEHVRCASLVHRQAVLLVALSIRQSEQLQAHSVNLAGIGWPRYTASWEKVTKEHEAKVRQTADEAEHLEHSLLRVRNRLWFTLISGREEETTILQLLQQAARTPELLDDITSEQAQVARRLDQLSTRLADNRSAATSDFLNKLSAFVGLVFIVDIAIGVAQVWTGASLTAALITMLVAIPPAGAAGYFLWRHFDNSKPPGPNATSGAHRTKQEGSPR